LAPLFYITPAFKLAVRRLRRETNLPMMQMGRYLVFRARVFDADQR